MTSEGRLDRVLALATRTSPSLPPPAYSMPVASRYVFHVYVAKHSSGRVLYVGYSRPLMGRMGQHERLADWWTSAAYVDVYEFDTEKDARAFEAEWIARLKPPYNTRGIGWATADEYNRRLDEMSREAV